MASIACGHNHTIFVTEDSKIFACGLSFMGQLGLGQKHADKVRKRIPKLLKGFHVESHLKIVASGGFAHTVFIKGK